MTQQTGALSHPDALAVGTRMHELFEEFATSGMPKARILDLEITFLSGIDPRDPSWQNTVGEVMAADDRDMLAPRTWLA